MKLALGSDHGGYELKEAIKRSLKERGYIVDDLGTGSLDSVDYPDYGKKVAETVAQGKHDRGILICGTGIGMSITANKIKGIRCALCHNVYTAKMAREHNDANILALGGRVLQPELALDIVETWLTTNFEGGRHQRRLDKIAALEK